MISADPAQWPAIIYGTAWKKEATADFVRRAVSAGYRAIDTANQPLHYNERGVGEGVAAALEEDGLDRGDLFLQTKFTPLDSQGEDVPYDPDIPLAQQVEASLEGSLGHLGTDYLDSYLLHGPHDPHRLTGQDLEVWAVMETFHERGLARRIGVSNVGVHHLRALCERAEVTPMTVQNRCFARFGWDHEVREFCAQHDIVYQGFSLLTANPFVLLDEIVTSLADKYGATPQQIVFAFAHQAGMIPLTGTTSEQHMQDDLEALKIALQAEEASAIDRLVE